MTDDPDTIAGFARRIEQVRAERKNAEVRLLRLTTRRTLTQSEIRETIKSLGGAVALLAEAEPADRRLVYEAADLQVLYDHQNQRAQVSIAPRVSGGVGGGT